MIRLVTIALLEVAALAACSPPADNATGTELGGSGVSAVATASMEPKDAPVPDGFARTAWRVMAEDGARYTTYLDADGSYRDLRNGDPWHEGQWTYTTGDTPRLCLEPEGENAVERCWEPGPSDGDTMEATGDDGRTIELERVEYVPVPDDADDAEDGDGAVG